MPLYCCGVCGWVTTAFRVDAVREHQVACPSCAGTMRIAFDAMPAVDVMPSAGGTPILADPKPILPDPQMEPERALNQSMRSRAERRGRRSRLDRGGVSANSRQRA